MRFASRPLTSIMNAPEMKRVSLGITGYQMFAEFVSLGVGHVESFGETPERDQVAGAADRCDFERG
jgi:hypothetical protein